MGAAEEWFMMLVEKSFDTGEVVLNYAEGPDNGPPIVLLPGGTMRWQDYYNPLISMLYNRWHIYAVNARGHGKSGRTPGKYRLKDYTSDVVTFTEELKEPATIFGHSMGGIIAVGAAAAALKDRLTGLILADPPITNHSCRTWVEQDLFQASTPQQIELMKSAKSVKDLANAMGEGNVTPGVLARATRFSQLDPEVMEFCLLEKMDEWLEEFDLDSFLSEITCPVFFP